MQRALELAALGLGRVSPNPMVGCVIVFDGKIVAEGWHRRYGGSHAEVNAINSVKDRSLLPKCELYVNLEPCSHHGKTPPCVDLIIASGIKKVIIANKDPNPLVAGEGVSKLKQHGIEVVEGLMKEEGAFLNRRFFTFHLKKRPYTILKWAQTADDFIARNNFESKWISNRQSRQLVHQYRAQEDAVMVGRNTAHYDDPELTVRHWYGRNPIRVVLDPRLLLDRGLKLFDGSVPTLIYNHTRNEKSANIELIKVSEDQLLEGIREDLYQRHVQSLMVEGGGRLLSSLLHRDYWDEARVFTSSMTFGEGIKAPRIQAASQHQCDISGDLLRIYYNHASY